MTCVFCYHFCYNKKQKINEEKKCLGEMYHEK